MKLLLIFLYSFLLNAQTIIEHSNPSCSKLKRLDSKGSVLENHPIQHQGDLSTCYANTASLMFFSKFKKDNPDSDLEQISWLSLAQENKKSLLKNISDKAITEDIFKRGGWVDQIYNSIKGKYLCGIPAKRWNKKEFNSSLESNAYLFEQVMNNYEKLFDDQSNFKHQEENNQYISSTCFNGINNNFDKGLLKNLGKARHVENFSVFWKYLKKPKIENLKRFKDYYMSHIFTSTFKQGESNALRFIATDTFFSGPDEIFIDSELKKFIEEEKMKSFKQDFYINATDVATAQEKALLPLKESLEKDFVSCIENSLKINEHSKVKSCNENNYNQVNNILNFTKHAASEGIAPSFIAEVLSMKSPLRSKQEILSQFMKSAYSNCSYPVPKNWKVVNMNRENLDLKSKENKKATTDFSLDVFNALIDLDLIGSISVKNNFFSNNKSNQESNGTHAMAVIGSASGCTINGKEAQRCILVQNSYGLGTESEEVKGTKDSKYPKHMIPGLKTKDAYSINGEIKYDKNLGYGKFWICDPKAIDEYMNGIGAIQ